MHREQHIHGADHVVGLCEDRVVHVDHRIRRGRHFAEVDDGVRLEFAEGTLDEVVVAEVTFKKRQRLTVVFPEDTAAIGHR
jgi:hypothetical protein